MSKMLSPYELSNADDWKSVNENNYLFVLNPKKEIISKIKNLEKNKSFIAKDNIIASYAIDEAGRPRVFWFYKKEINKVLENDNNKP